MKRFLVILNLGMIKFLTWGHLGHKRFAHGYFLKGEELSTCLLCQTPMLNVFYWTAQFLIQKDILLRDQFKWCTSKLGHLSCINLTYLMWFFLSRFLSFTVFSAWRKPCCWHDVKKNKKIIMFHKIKMDSNGVLFVELCQSKILTYIQWCFGTKYTKKSCCSFFLFLFFFSGIEFCL